MNFEEFFKQAYGTYPRPRLTPCRGRHSGSREAAIRNPEKELDKDFGPYDYQRKLAEKPWPDLLEVSIGMGKNRCRSITSHQDGPVKQPKSIETRILTIRGHNVIIDADLAELYGVPTKALNQAIKRNADRFPDDFIFRLTKAEKLEVVTNCDHLARLKFARALPWAFTEHGATMAATVMNSS